LSISVAYETNTKLVIWQHDQTISDGDGTTAKMTASLCQQFLKAVTDPTTPRWVVLKRWELGARPRRSTTHRARSPFDSHQWRH
jgi:hypothetical protein